MKSCFRRWSKSSFITVAVCFLVYITTVQNGLLLMFFSHSRHLADLSDGGKGLGTRKLLEDEALPEVLHSNNSRSSPSRRLPQCIIVGARKCGTRALINFLSIHSKIVSPGDEMHFFSNDTNYKLGLEWYRKKMPLSLPNQITIEKTPKYFVSKEAPSRIHRMNSSIKLIVLLRHPTTRLISDYTQIYANRATKNETVGSFESLAIKPSTGHVNLEYKALQTSIYHQHVARWLEIFPRSQLLILDGDHFIGNPIAEIRKVERFLKLRHEVTEDGLYFNQTRGFFCIQKTRHRPERCLGVSKGRKHVDISDTLVQKFDRFFKPHNERLYKLIKRRFQWR